MGIDVRKGKVSLDKKGKAEESKVLLAELPYGLKGFVKPCH